MIGQMEQERALSEMGRSVGTPLLWDILSDYPEPHTDYVNFSYIMEFVHFCENAESLDGFSCVRFSGR